MLAIREATTTDLRIILDLLEDAKLPNQDIGASSINQFLVACNDSVILGCIGMEIYGQHGLLRSLCVHPSARDQGVATMLVDAVESKACDTHLASLYLLTMRASEFFIKRGYQLVDRSAAPEVIRASTQFAGLCPAQASCLHKVLQ